MKRQQKKAVKFPAARVTGGADLEKHGEDPVDTALRMGVEALLLSSENKVKEARR